jgi:hypothetical protein
MVFIRQTLSASLPEIVKSHESIFAEVLVHNCITANFSLSLSLSATRDTLDTELLSSSPGCSAKQLAAFSRLVRRCLQFLPPLRVLKLPPALVERFEIADPETRALCSAWWL